jgi:hypothetical protein
VQEGSACSHPEPRTWRSEAKHRRQFALGVPAFAKATAGPPKLGESDPSEGWRALAPVKKSWAGNNAGRWA